MMHAPRILLPGSVLLTLSALVFASSPSPGADPQQRGRPARPGAVPASPTPPVPRSALLTSDAWRATPRTPIKPEEIDQLVARELARSQLTPAPLTTDEQFLRRVTLDLTGQLPRPAEVDEFVADPDPAKRPRLIEKLLDSDEYAHHWARYWRDVLESRITDVRGRLLARSFESWLTEQLEQNHSWGEITRALLTAQGEVRYGQAAQPERSGAAFFLASHIGTDAANERAAEASRVFLGIQIQCAQCHDHPFDQWKRVQFHELAAYFARLRERPVRDKQRVVGMELISAPGGEHRMPSKEDPRKTIPVQPHFLDGSTPGANLGDKPRRQALARAIVDKDNYWFAAAYVNRVWGELMGQSFYEPVDDMGPGKEAIFPELLTRLAASFAGTDYDIKALLRAILNSQTYQRQLRPVQSADGHLHFASAYPSRLRPDALWDSLVAVLGVLGRPPQAPPSGPRLQAPGLEGLFLAEFGFDPSTKPSEVEGSIPQALMLMNNPAINQRIFARGPNLLGKILKDYPQDDEALRAVYQRVLARKPTDREKETCLAYLAKARTRAEAFEDILWSLLNSTEFLTRR
jgi:hypothetical protein